MSDRGMVTPGMRQLPLNAVPASTCADISNLLVGRGIISSKDLIWKNWRCDRVYEIPVPGPLRCGWLAGYGLSSARLDLQLSK